MSKVELELKGMDEVLKRLEEMGRKGNTVANRALKKGAEPILKEMKTLVPVDTGRGRDSLKIGSISTKKGFKSIPIGLVDVGDAYYLIFQEYGTSKMQAQPFMAPAYEKNKDKARKIIIDEIRRELGL